MILAFMSIYFVILYFCTREYLTQDSTHST